MKLRLIIALPLACFLVACEKKAELDLSSVPVDAIPQGVASMATHCQTCHAVGELAMEEMLAPPLWGVRAHYLAKYSEPEAFVAAMTDFILKPSTEKSLMPQAVAHYGLKAPVSLNEDKIREVAWAIYAGQAERPPWSREYRKRHRDCEVRW